MDIEFRKLRRAIWNVFREYYLSYAVIAFYFSFPRDPSFSRVLFLHLPLSILCPKKRKLISICAIGNHFHLFSFSNVSTFEKFHTDENMYFFFFVNIRYINIVILEIVLNSFFLDNCLK